MDLSTFEQKESPFKVILRERGIKPATIANYLGLGYGYTCNLLNGIQRMSPAVETKLKELARGVSE